ncbi:DUF6356 family protein [Labrys wisconsinensis]|uniref:Capsule biosynthesis protein n=1 Tax=Labrys wisconsinensis TaxID=425677 RepID=A0ABU0J1F5_9HYPH|nr:DUF6356 family protein [Labrys wisconsinensis]MDQ0468086.1 hypothetical protein [Labrys wisconsinensis]
MAKLSFTAHPESVGETYVEHLGVASSFGFAMIAGGLACLAHGFFPFLFTSTGSRTVARLHERMVAHRRRGAAAG